jgi:ATP-dependent DNA helicase RecG
LNWKIPQQHKLPSKKGLIKEERINKRLWDSVTLREAIINAFVHNDFSNEVPPKFELFPNRIEITSAGGLPDGLSQKEFFLGFSVPRNKELMRIFKDLGMVEQLGSGVPRILKSYGEDCFAFSDNFLRMTFPAQRDLTPQVTPPSYPPSYPSSYPSS